MEGNASPALRDSDEADRSLLTVNEALLNVGDESDVRRECDLGGQRRLARQPLRRTALANNQIRRELLALVTAYRLSAKA